MKTVTPRSLLTSFTLAISIACVLGSATDAAPKARAKSADGYVFVAKSPGAKALHKKLVTGGRLTTAQYRLLADQGDRFAAYRFAKMLEKSPKVAISDVVHYYSIAVRLGQFSAVPPLAVMLRIHHAEIPQPRLELAHMAIKRAADRGDIFAMRTLASFYRDGTPFGRDDVKSKALMIQAAKLGDEQAAFEMGASLSTGQRTPEELDEARTYLAIAARSGNVIARALLSELEQRQ